MPMINIKLIPDGITAEQKKELIAGATDLMVRVLGKNPATTIVIIEEVDTESWGVGGQSVEDRRKGAG
jgi:4-oxalocrotonate tautomerase